MNDNFEIIGEWFLPENEKRAHGTLSYEKNGKAILTLYGNLNGDETPFTDFINQDIILGVSSKSKEITLLNCFMSGSGGPTFSKGKETGKHAITYIISYLFIGLHINRAQDLVFNKISTQIFNLDEWVATSGFVRETPALEKIQNHEFSINYKLPNPVEFKIDNNFDGKFNFIAKLPNLTIYQKEQNISQKVEFQILSKKDIFFKELLKKVIQFQDFLLCALYQKTSIISINLSGDQHQDVLGDGKKYPKKIELYMPSLNFSGIEKPKSPMDMIFNYRQISEEFPRLIKNWYAKYELLEPAFNLVFEQFYQNKRFTENSFLNLAQAAETFHARIHNHTKIPREEYKIMKNEILESTDSKYHEWLKAQFNFGNNLNLHQRLEELVHKYSNSVIDKLIPNKDRFVFEVKHSRNYYTHYSKSTKKNALKGEDLYYISEKLKLLLICSFLIEIGFDDNQLSNFLSNVEWRLFNHLFD